MTDTVKDTLKRKAEEPSNAIVAVANSIRVFEDDEDERNETDMMKRATWQNKMLMALREGNATFLKSLAHSEDLKNGLSFTNNYRNMLQHSKELYPNPHAKLIVNPPKANKYTYQIGFLQRGGFESYYCWDYVKLKPFNGVFGPFYSATWATMPIMNKIFGNIMTINQKANGDKAENDDNADLMLQPNVIIKQFDITNDIVFSIDPAQNESIVSTDNYSEKLKVDKMSPQLFNKLFGFPGAKDAKPGEPLQFEESRVLMGFVIEGVKESKSETYLETVNAKRCKIKQYTIAIKPKIIFMEIESEEIGTTPQLK
ncbi:DBP [Operophtera brumata nucleopolyhedrovirus]|uniref:DBP n=1 Tax=Operophtera brumata nucleopolyhedrovirus TaxID=1046267 RepID=A0A2H4UZS0_9ABAC|nr:DBP [Operophtera brumata nucleopolyhedrovirus]AUA60248.1 DBP [Operophtera brumata nucleopolyhedrovirus]